MNRETPNEVYAVEFFPSADDYAYIANKVSRTVPTPDIVTYAYQAFLLLNSIVFPAFLWYKEYFYAGLMVLILNTCTLYFVLPWFGSVGLKRFYNHAFGNRENNVVTVQLNTTGVNYASDGGTLFLPWRRIDAIEESDESVYFLFEGNGVAVRKSGFPYQETESAFVNFAKRNLAEAKQNILDA